MLLITNVSMPSCGPTLRGRGGSRCPTNVSGSIGGYGEANTLVKAFIPHRHLLMSNSETSDVGGLGRFAHEQWPWSPDKVVSGIQSEPAIYIQCGPSWTELRKFIFSNSNVPQGVCLRFLADCPDQRSLLVWLTLQRFPDGHACN